METKQNDGGQAFPMVDVLIDGQAIGSAGMSIRDYFAGQALIGLLSGRPDSECDEIGYAGDAYRFADAMLKARAE
jgi:hypothetical protein